MHHQPGQLEHVHDAGRGDQHRVREDQQGLPAKECVPWLQVRCPESCYNQLREINEKVHNK